MQLEPFKAARRIAVCFLLLVLALTSCVSSPEARSARFIETGKKLLKNKDTSRAILQFQNAVKASPRSAEAYYQLATAFMAGGTRFLLWRHSAMRWNSILSTRELSFCSPS